MLFLSHVENFIFKIFFSIIMLKSKVFLKKTKRGGILKIVREHYLRDDILCGYPLCPKCSEEDEMEVDEYEANNTKTPQQTKHIKLSSKISMNFDGNAEQHIIIPDTNVVLHQVGMVGKATYTNNNILFT